MSDVDDSPGKEFCYQHEAQCVKCGKRGCNDNPLKWEEDLACIKCSPNIIHNCEEIGKDLSAIECTASVAGYTNGCYTVVKNHTVHRGCLLEATEDVRSECSDEFSEQCSVCRKSDCNRDNVYPGVFCYNCDSATDEKCFEKMDDSMEKDCASNHKGCYLIRENGNFSVLKIYFYEIIIHFYPFRLFTGISKIV